MNDPKILIIGGHGLGDSILALQCASFITNSNVNHYQPTIKISTRPEVFKALNWAFGGLFTLHHIDEKYSAHEAILQDKVLFNEVTAGFDEVYYVIPDLLFGNPYAFDYKKYNTHPQTIKSKRLLTNRATPTRQIYLGLTSSTDGYVYTQVEKLAVGLAKSLPDYHILLPSITQWAGKSVAPFKIEKCPSNLTVIEDRPLESCIENLRHSCYFVGTDNGPSHLAYHYGIPRLILDPQFARMPWVARWKEDVTECIPIAVSPETIIDIVTTNINIPQTCLIPRGIVARECALNPNTDWKHNLLLKYE